MKIIPGLYAIYDHPHRGGVDAASAVRSMLAGGVRCLQLRAKQATTAERTALLGQIGPACAAAGCQLWVNDDLHAARSGAVGVTGLHVGQEDVPHLPPDWRATLRAAGLGLGISTHDLGQLARADALEPDYLAFGPVFTTTGKRDPDPTVGLAGLERAAAATDRPLVAIGGIDLGQVAACFERGATAVAVIGALVAPTSRGIEQRADALILACRDALAPPGPGAIPDEA